MMGNFLMHMLSCLWRWKKGGRDWSFSHRNGKRRLGAETLEIQTHINTFGKASKPMKQKMHGDETKAETNKEGSLGNFSDKACHHHMCCLTIAFLTTAFGGRSDMQEGRQLLTLSLTDIFSIWPRALQTCVKFLWNLLIIQKCAMTPPFIPSFFVKSSKIKCNHFVLALWLIIVVDWITTKKRKGLFCCSLKLVCLQTCGSETQMNQFVNCICGENVKTDFPNANNHKSWPWPTNFARWSLRS